MHHRWAWDFQCKRWWDSGFRAYRERWHFWQNQYWGHDLVCCRWSSLTNWEYESLLKIQPRYFRARSLSLRIRRGQSNDSGNGARINGQLKCCDHQLQKLHPIPRKHWTLARHWLAVEEPQLDPHDARFSHSDADQEPSWLTGPDSLVTAKYRNIKSSCPK